MARKNRNVKGCGKKKQRSNWTNLLNELRAKQVQQRGCCPSDSKKVEPVGSKS